MNELLNDLECTLISEAEIQSTVETMAKTLTKEYKGKRPIMVCILRGSIVFFADLCRKMECDMVMDFMVASSYGDGTVSNGKVDIKKDLSEDIAGKDVVIVEDIIDSGYTLHLLKEELLRRNPASLKIVTLLSKDVKRKAPIEADMVGLHVPDKFVVGYGLDYNERYRNIPFIGVLKRNVYE